MASTIELSHVVGLCGGASSYGSNGDVVLLREPAAPCLASDPLVIDAGVAPLPLNWLDVDGDGNVTELLPVDFAGNPRVSRARSDLDAIEVVP